MVPGTGPSLLIAGQVLHDLKELAETNNTGKMSLAGMLDRRKLQLERMAKLVISALVSTMDPL